MRQTGEHRRDANAVCPLLALSGLPNLATEVSAFWACLTLGLTFATQRAWQVLANVQRPSAAFASLSRRDNAWRNPRRPALVCDRRWADSPIWTAVNLITAGVRLIVTREIIHPRSNSSSVEENDRVRRIFIA
jgi:hypothetical protein